MPRTKGSLNKATIQAMNAEKANRNGVYITKFEKYVEGSAVTKKSGMGWVNWGVKNNMPTILLDLFNQSTTHRACINFEVQSIIGNGVDIEAMKIDGSQIVPNYYQDFDTFLRAIALDYSLFGSYAIQIIMNKDRKTYSFYHIPLDKVRWSPYDEDGQITTYWICNDWTETGLNPPIEVEAFDMREDYKIDYGKPYLYVYRPYTPTMNYYTQPTYQAGLKSIYAEVEVSNYDLKAATNSFVPAGMLVLNDVETDEERRAVIKNVQSLFQGTDNASSCMITFRNNIEEQKPEWIPFTANQGNVNLFADANDRIIDRIVSAHQIPSKTLIGLNNKNTGFNSEGAFLEAAYSLYNTLVGNNNRNAIIKSINFMLKMNGINLEIILKPLTFQLEDTAEEPKNNTDSQVTEEDVDDNKASNIEEKKEGNNSEKD